jgi:predicted ribosome quality control (RQC) complex YloA/Tae2 family protein
MGPKLLGNVIAELNDLLRGGVISKIHQPSERVIILKIFCRGRDERLLISAEPKFPRMHLLGEDHTVVNPPAPLRFCAFLRSRLTNALVDGFIQTMGERIASIVLKKKSDSTIDTMTLVCELTGKSANIILVDEKRVVLDAIRYFPPESARVVMPGVAFAPLPKGELKEAEGPVEKGEGSWNEAAFRYYSTRVDVDERAALRASLRRAINEARKKAERKLTNLQGDKTRAEKELDFGRLGEMLVSDMKSIKRGAKEARVLDYTKVPPETVLVPLDEKLGPKENVEKYFKRARKAKVALGLLKGRIPEVEEDITYIDSLVYELDAAHTMEDLIEIETELVAEGYLRRPPPVKEAEKVRVEPIRRFTSSTGFEMLCGKSGLGNDLIVRKYAKEGDVWFHASGVPGSHVLIKSAGRLKELTDATIKEAAQIAAWYSKSQGAAKAEVVYTDAKNVKKPKGAKPGSVTITGYKTIIVAPGNPEEGKKK